MNIETIYESFFDTYRNMGQIISELSLRTIQQAKTGALAGAEEAEQEARVRKTRPTWPKPRTAGSNPTDTTALDLNKTKLAHQAARFEKAAKKKEAQLQAAAGNKPGRAHRATLVSNNLRRSGGYNSEAEKRQAQDKAETQAINLPRLRKRFRGELDGA